MSDTPWVDGWELMVTTDTGQRIPVVHADLVRAIERATPAAFERVPSPSDPRRDVLRVGGAA